MSGGVDAQTITLSLAISADQLAHYYRGRARQISAVADDGRRVQFPASAVQGFVTRDGIHGRFALRIDACGKLMDIQRLAAPAR